jgi:hypothetical protein
VWVYNVANRLIFADFKGADGAEAFGKGVKMPYIPRSDTDLLAWTNNLTIYICEHLAELGIGEDEIARIETARITFYLKMNDNIAAQQAAETAREQKDASRDILEAVIRQVVQELLALGDVDDKLRRLAPGIFEHVS